MLSRKFIQKIIFCMFILFFIFIFFICFRLMMWQYGKYRNILDYTNRYDNYSDGQFNEDRTEYLFVALDSRCKNFVWFSKDKLQNIWDQAILARVGHVASNLSYGVILLRNRDIVYQKRDRYFLSRLQYEDYFSMYDKSVIPFTTSSFVQLACDSTYLNKKIKDDFLFFVQESYPESQYKHLSYAIQWFIGMLLSLSLSLKSILMFYRTPKT